MSCIFCKIIQGEVPCKKVYEDSEIIAFHDLHPKAPVHVLVVPKMHVESLAELNETHKEMISHLTLKLPEIAKLLHLNNGFRTQIHTGAGGGQEIFHLHYHVLGQPA